MSPKTRRGGPLATDRPNVADTAKSQPTKPSAAVGQGRAASPLYVYAEVREVAGRHRDRLEMFVRCPACGRTHAHRAPVLFLSGKRTAPCGVRYVVVAGLALEGAA